MNDQIKSPAGEDQQIDDLFRKTLGGHAVEPSGQVWKGINRKLLWKEISHFNFSNVTPGQWMAVSAVIFIILGFFLFYPATKPTLKAVDQVALTQGVNPGTGTQTANGPKSPAERTGTKQEIAETRASAKQGIAQNKVKSGPAAISAKPSQVTRMKQSVSAEAGTHPVAASQPAGKNTGVEAAYIMPDPIRTNGNSYSHMPDFSIIAMESLDAYGIYTNDMRDTLISFRTPTGIMNIQTAKQPVPQSFSANLGVMPEVVNYSTDHNYREMNYWLNGRFSYHVSRFSFSAGVSLGYVFDEGKYDTKYISKDSIGYFTDIISFYLDPENQNQLIFSTKNVTVYDSLQHYADDRTRNRYTYLEIPLTVGYQVLETSRLSLDVIFGPSVSFLIHTHEAAPYIDYPNARIVRIDDNTTQRVKTSWKLGLSLNLEYKISKNLGCYLEPSYKYYFNTYSGDAESYSQEPYSFGIGLGVRYHFGFLTSKKQ